MRRVVAVQRGNPIFTLSASFQLDQPGIDHQDEIPDVPRPEQLATLDERLDAVRTSAAEFYKAMPGPSSCATWTNRPGAA